MPGSDLVEYVVELSIVTEDDSGPPEEWAWERLLELMPHESVFVRRVSGPTKVEE